MKLIFPRVLGLLLFASICLNGFLLLRTIPIELGGGNGRPSSANGLHAFAQGYKNLNPMASNSNIVRGEALIRTSENLNDQCGLLRFTIEPPGIANEMGYRDIEDLITWSPDGRIVTYEFPHLTLTVGLKLGHPMYQDLPSR